MSAEQPWNPDRPNEMGAESISKQEEAERAHVPAGWQPEASSAGSKRPGETLKKDVFEEKERTKSIEDHDHHNIIEHIVHPKHSLERYREE